MVNRRGDSRLAPLPKALVLLLAVVLVAWPLSSAPASRASTAGIGSWSQTTSYPASVAYQGCFSDGGDIYCVGGISNMSFSSSSPPPSPSYFAPLSSSGVGQWQSTTPLPVPSFFPSCAAVSGYVYCIGGVTMNLTFFAPISASGIGQWVTSTEFPDFSPAGNCAESGGYFYCVGGIANSSTSTVLPYTYSSQLSASGFGPWSKSGAFPSQTLSSQNGAGFCNAYGGYLYCVPSSGTVFSASVSGGNVGQWSQASSGYAGVSVPTCVGYSGVLYCVGGFSASNQGSDATAYVSVSGNSIGQWASGATYPIGVFLPSCAVGSGYLYCVGGVPSIGSLSSMVTSVYFAPLNGSPVTTSSTTTQTTVSSTLSSGPPVNISVGGSPAAAVYDAANGDVYVANPISFSVSVISGSSDSVVATVPLSGSPTQLAFDPANGDVYAAGGSSVFVISGSTNTVIATIPIIQYAVPSGMAYDPANGNIYISNSDYEVMPVVSTQSNSYVANVTLNNAVGEGIAYDPSTGYMYVAAGDSIQVISPQSFSVVNTLTGVNASGAILFDSGNGYLYAVNYGGFFAGNVTGSVTVVSPATGSVVATIPTPYAAAGLALDPSNGDVYATGSVATSSTGASVGTTVMVISGSTNTIVANLSAGSEPYGVAYDSSNGRIYVTNAQSGSVTSISVSAGSTGSTTSTTTAASTTAASTTSATSVATSTTSESSSGQQTTTASSSSTGTATSHSSSTSSGGGIPEFPFQMLALTALTVVVVLSYLLVRRRGSLFT